MFSEQPYAKFFQAYVECALWADLPENDKNTCFIDLPSDVKEEMWNDCVKFYDNNSHMWNDDEQAGHDFWLTRQGHGAGFWDRPKDVYGEFADILTEKSKEYGEVWYDCMLTEEE